MFTSYSCLLVFESSIATARSILQYYNMLSGLAYQAMPKHNSNEPSSTCMSPKAACR